MTPQTNDNHTQATCRWIGFGQQSNGRVSNWTRALCMRTPEAPRPVTEHDCAGCKYWEPIGGSQG